MIDIIVFSKDRACQLDLCLRTLRENFPADLIRSTTVQYTHSNENFKAGYDKLKKIHPINFIKENDFEETFKSKLNECAGEFVLFFADDDIIVEKIDKNELSQLIEKYRTDKNIHSLSLRMNPKINYCFPAHKSIAPPIKTFEIGDFYFYWDWPAAENQHLCWGYPMSILSHIYKREWFNNIVLKLKFNNANSLESQINRNRDFTKKRMLSFKRTKVFNSQNNFVQGKRIGETYGLDVEQLNEKILNNSPIKGFSIKQEEGIISCHGNVEYRF